MSLKVSIVVPVYNAEKTLQTSLESILNQSYSDLDVICVDDGSTDSSLEILESYAKRDNRLTILKQENKFAGIARNNGMAQAKGEYIMFLDSDDIFEKNMVSFLVKKAKTFDPDIIVFGYWKFKETTKKRRPLKYLYKNDQLNNASEINDNIFQITRSLPWDKFIKMEFLRKTGLQYQGTKVNNDIFFNRTIVTVANRILFCRKRLINYRINNNNSLQGKLNNNPVDFIKANMAIYEELSRRNTIDLFRNSFETVIVSDLIMHLSRINTYEEYKTIVSTLNKTDFFKRLGISENSKAVQESSYFPMLQELIKGNIEDTLVNLYTCTRENFVSMKTAEYRIGSKVIKFLGLTY